MRSAPDLTRLRLVSARESAAMKIGPKTACVCSLFAVAICGCGREIAAPHAGTAVQTAAAESVVADASDELAPPAEPETVNDPAKEAANDPAKEAALRDRIAAAAAKPRPRGPGDVVVTGATFVPADGQDPAWTTETADYRGLSKTHVAVFRVFLENPVDDERVMTRGRLWTLDREYGGFSQGTYEMFEPGSFVGLELNPRGERTIEIASPYHTPAEAVVAGFPENARAAGDVLLSRPPAQERADIRVELTREDGTPVIDWTFYFGAITFGGPYGTKVPLDRDGTCSVSGLAPQTLQVGFAERLLAKYRAEVELRADRTTVLSYRLEDDLEAPSVRYEARLDQSE